MSRARQLGIGMVGAGTMAGAHSLALSMLAALYPDLPLRPRLVAVADVNQRLASALAERYGYGRVEADWRRLVESPDVDLVVTCLPPASNSEVVLGAAPSYLERRGRPQAVVTARVEIDVVHADEERILGLPGKRQRRDAEDRIGAHGTRTSTPKLCIKNA